MSIRTFFQNDDLLMKMLEYHDGLTLAKSTRVSRSWRTRCSEENLWKDIYLKHNDGLKGMTFVYDNDTLHAGGLKEAFKKQTVLHKKMLKLKNETYRYYIKPK